MKYCTINRYAILNNQKFIRDGMVNNWYSINVWTKLSQGYLILVRVLRIPTLVLYSNGPFVTLTIMTY